MYFVFSFSYKLLSQQENLRLYPSGSCPGKFYGTAKVHKISENDTVDELPILPIISNFGTCYI